MKTSVTLLLLSLLLWATNSQATELRMTIAYGDKAIAHNEIKLHFPDANIHFAEGKTDRHGRVTFYVNGSVPSRVDVYGAVRDGSNETTWNVKGGTVVRYDNNDGYYWAVLDLKEFMKTVNNAVDEGMEDSVFEDDPMFQMAKGVIKGTANTMEAAWGIPLSTQYNTRPIYPTDPNFKNGTEPTLTTAPNDNSSASFSSKSSSSSKNSAEAAAAAQKRQEEEEERRKKEEREREREEGLENLGLFEGTYTVRFQSKDNTVPFNVYINGELATSYASLNQTVQVKVLPDLMTDIRIEFEDGSQPEITRRAPIGAKDNEGNIIQAYAFTIKKKKNGKVVMNRRLI